MKQNQKLSQTYCSLSHPNLVYLMFSVTCTKGGKYDRRTSKMDQGYLNSHTEVTNSQEGGKVVCLGLTGRRLRILN